MWQIATSLGNATLKICFSCKSPESWVNNSTPPSCERHDIKQANFIKRTTRPLSQVSLILPWSMFVLNLYLHTEFSALHLEITHLDLPSNEKSRSLNSRIILAKIIVKKPNFICSKLNHNFQRAVKYLETKEHIIYERLLTRYLILSYRYFSIALRTDLSCGIDELRSISSANCDN